MSTYVMSDLHGFYDTFLKMLKKIDFSDDDTLYIIGDVIDRGPDGVKILQYVMKTPNIVMLLGNHELMCLNYFQKNTNEALKRRWNRNGNYNTLLGFDNVTDEEKENILSFIRKLPSELRIQVGNTSYILVHGFLGEDDFHKVWNRPKLDEKVNLKENERIIIGHTPVSEYVCPGSDEDMYVYSHNLTKKSKHFEILYTDSFIDIDCCMGYYFSAGRMACLRLDDLQEFYEALE